MSNKDSCWLTKKIADDRYQGYYLNDTSKIATTIADEFSALFVGMHKRNNQEDADIVFDLVSDARLGQEGFEVVLENHVITILANHSKGLLYGFYHLYTVLAQGADIVSLTSIPDQSKIGRASCRERV